MPGLDPLSDLWVVHLKHEGLLSGFRASLLGHPVARSANLDKLLDVYTGLLRCWLLWCILGLFCGPPSEVALMFLAL